MMSIHINQGAVPYKELESFLSNIKGVENKVEFLDNVGRCCLLTGEDLVLAQAPAQGRERSI